VNTDTPLLNIHLLLWSWSLCVLRVCRTILYVSMIYCTGNVILTIAAIPFDGSYFQ